MGRLCCRSRRRSGTLRRLRLAGLGLLRRRLCRSRLPRHLLRLLRDKLRLHRNRLGLLGGRFGPGLCGGGILCQLPRRRLGALGGLCGRLHGLLRLR